MYTLDEDILRAYMRLEESQRQRLWLERLLHPENFNWKQRGAPPPITNTKKIRIQVLGELGFNEEYYQRMFDIERASKKDMGDLVKEHPLWPHFERIPGFGPYLSAAFVAAGGDITRTPKVSSFWKGMGLDVLEDGTVPRKTRKIVKAKVEVPDELLSGDRIQVIKLRSELDGSLPFGALGRVIEVDDEGNIEVDFQGDIYELIKGEDEWVLFVNERKIPALPHVTKIGEQIRQSVILKTTGSFARHLYEKYYDFYQEKYPPTPQGQPGRKKMFNYKAGLRSSQKILYSCLWREWRLGYGLPAPDSYPYDILKHDRGGMIVIQDFYSDEKLVPRKRGC